MPRKKVVKKETKKVVVKVKPVEKEKVYDFGDVQLKGYIVYDFEPKKKYGKFYFKKYDLTIISENLEQAKKDLIKKEFSAWID